VRRRQRGVWREQVPADACREHAGAVRRAKTTTPCTAYSGPGRWPHPLPRSREVTIRKSWAIALWSRPLYQPTIMGMRSRPILNTTLLRGRRGHETVKVEVHLLGPEPSEPFSAYVVRLTPAPGEQPIDLDVGALLTALTPPSALTPQTGL